MQDSEQRTSVNTSNNAVLIWIAVSECKGTTLSGTVVTPPVCFASLLYVPQNQLSCFLQYSLLFFQNVANDSVVTGEEGQENGHNSSTVKEPPRKKNRKK